MCCAATTPLCCWATGVVVAVALLRGLHANKRPALWRAAPYRGRRRPSPHRPARPARPPDARPLLPHRTVPRTVPHRTAPHRRINLQYDLLGGTGIPNPERDAYNRCINFLIVTLLVAAAHYCLFRAWGDWPRLR